MKKLSDSAGEKKSVLLVGDSANQLNAPLIFLSNKFFAIGVILVSLLLTLSIHSVTFTEEIPNGKLHFLCSVSTCFKSSINYNKVHQNLYRWVRDCSFSIRSLFRNSNNFRIVLGPSTETWIIPLGFNVLTTSLRLTRTSSAAVCSKNLEFQLRIETWLLISNSI